jgi:peptide/nickel transport system substrate-binding protein
VRLESFPDYRNGAPAIAGVTCRFVSDPGERIAGLAAGEVDLVPNLLPEFAEKAPQLIRAPGLDQPLILLNAKAGLTRDVRVRQALNLAVDKDTIAKMVFLGHAKPSAGQVLIPGMAGFNPEIDAYPYDPERAWSLVLEAGAEGMPIELVGATGRWPKDKDLLEVVAAYWEAAGLQPRVRALDPAAYAAFRAENAPRPDGLMTRTPNRLGEAGPVYAALLNEEDAGSAHSDRELAELIAAARMESSKKRRAALYQQVARRAHENAYCVWLVVPDRLYGAAPRIQWVPSADGSLRFSEMRVAE